MNVGNRFIRHALGGPTVAEHEQLKLEKQELQAKYDLLLAQHEEACRQVLFLTTILYILCFWDNHKVITFLTYWCKSLMWESLGDFKS